MPLLHLTKVIPRKRNRNSTNKPQKTAIRWSEGIHEVHDYCTQNITYRHSVRPLIPFIVIVIVFVIAQYQNTKTEHAFRVNHAVEDALVDSAFESSDVQITYSQIGSVTDWYNWLELVLLPTVYRYTYDNGDMRPEDELDYVLNGNILFVGELRLRTHRVDPEECGSFETVCFPAYSSSTESFDWHEGPWFELKTDLKDMPAAKHVYGDKGFVFDFPKASETAAANVLGNFTALRENLWLDSASRVAAVQFLLFQPTNDFIVWSQFATEFSELGDVTNTYKVNSLRVTMDGFTDMQIAFIVLLPFFFLYTAREYYLETRERLWRIRALALPMDFRTIQQTFMDFWTTMEVFNIILFLVSISLWSFRVDEIQDKDFEPTDSVFQDYSRLVPLLHRENTVAGFNVILCCIRVFKYVRLNPRLVVIWNTMSKAIHNTLVILVVFLILLLGFAWAGFLMFGYLVYDYRNFAIAISSLLRTILGDFDYQALTIANSSFAPLFMVSYVVVVVIVVFNLFIAVIVEAFDEAKDERVLNEGRLDKSKLGVDVFNTLKKAYERMSRACNHMVSARRSRSGDFSYVPKAAVGCDADSDEPGEAEEGLAGDHKRRSWQKSASKSIRNMASESMRSATDLKQASRYLMEKSAEEQLVEIMHLIERDPSVLRNLNPELFEHAENGEVFVDVNDLIPLMPKLAYVDSTRVEKMQRVLEMGKEQDVQETDSRPPAPLGISPRISGLEGPRPDGTPESRADFRSASLTPPDSGRRASFLARAKGERKSSRASLTGSAMLNVAQRRASAAEDPVYALMKRQCENLEEIGRQMTGVHVRLGDLETRVMGLPPNDDGADDAAVLVERPSAPQAADLVKPAHDASIPTADDDDNENNA